MQHFNFCHCVKLRQTSSKWSRCCHHTHGSIEQLWPGSVLLLHTQNDADYQWLSVYLLLYYFQDSFQLRSHSPQESHHVVSRPACLFACPHGSGSLWSYTRTSAANDSKPPEDADRSGPRCSSALLPTSTSHRRCPLSRRRVLSAVNINTGPRVEIRAWGHKSEERLPDLLERILVK